MPQAPYLFIVVIHALNTVVKAAFHNNSLEAILYPSSTTQ
jgi:hypothetical protein